MHYHTWYLSHASQPVVVEKNLSCGENFPYDRLSCGEVSPHEKCEENLSHTENYPRDKCGAKYVVWRNLSCGEMFYITVVSTRVMRNVEQICSV